MCSRPIMLIGVRSREKYFWVSTCTTIHLFAAADVFVFAGCCSKAHIPHFCYVIHGFHSSVQFSWELILNWEFRLMAFKIRIYLISSYNNTVCIFSFKSIKLCRSFNSFILTEFSHWRECYLLQFHWTYDFIRLYLALHWIMDFICAFRSTVANAVLECFPTCDGYYREKKSNYFYNVE